MITFRLRNAVCDELNTGCEKSVECATLQLSKTCSMLNLGIQTDLSWDLLSGHLYVKSSQIYLHSTFHVQNNSKCFTEIKALQEGAEKALEICKIIERIADQNVCQLGVLRDSHVCSLRALSVILG